MSGVQGPGATPLQPPLNNFPTSSTQSTQSPQGPQPTTRGRSNGVTQSPDSPTIQKANACAPGAFARVGKAFTSLLNPSSKSHKGTLKTDALSIKVDLKVLNEEQAKRQEIREAHKARFEAEAKADIFPKTPHVTLNAKKNEVSCAMAKLLYRADSAEFLKAFCERNFQPENINFLMDIIIGHKSIEEMKNTYIKEGSPQSVNLPAKVYDKIMDPKNKSGDFTEAFDEIADVLNRNIEGNAEFGDSYTKGTFAIPPKKR